ncbi:agarase [Seonamhaeicola maritimus]|uniref:Agarase n=1 Tax=Seonamhaeicola maritimus TaxID=2591822 RepID=A0A5C7GE57_9FLAO|nr:agarase [Seonamhaeicola maritimus]TXG34846.1 agarase [Seonamhaeicola maritimus]
MYKLSVLFLLVGLGLNAQTQVDVNLNVKHSVGGVSEFQRSKFITIHAAINEAEWDGDNFADNLRQDFFEKHNVFMGRNTGGISWYLNNIQEDPNRKGYADPAEITSRGIEAKNYYLECKWLHEFKDRSNLIIAPQFQGFWTGRSQQPTQQGWKLAGADAVGEFTGRFANQFYGGLGPNEINYIEIINEPAYETLGGPNNFTSTIEDIANFHSDAAKAIKAYAPKVKVGGYTAAFPNLDLGDFKRWENRWKMFIDMVGNDMDFWSLHLYDFPSISNGKSILRSGSNIEATLDMIDHYSQLSLGKVKPYVISEFGSQMHDYMSEQWSSYRDWLHIKALNSQLMAFLERPNTIEMAIPFIVAKAEWGYWDNIPYNHRLLRKENEPESYTGKWVYTDLIKFYDLWKNVKGTRVDTYTNDLDVLVDAYVDENKAFVILNNLEDQTVEIDLNLFAQRLPNIISIEKRHLTLKGEKVFLDEETLKESIQDVKLGAESTMIIEYTFKEAIAIDNNSDETKYYADNYYKPIHQNQKRYFNINQITKAGFGEAILRLGAGREHGKSLKPSITINGVNIVVPDNWRGYDQADRSSFFGVLEIPIPYHLITEQNNIIEIEFPDSGGHISSVCLQVFNFNSPITRTENSNIQAQ